MNSEERKYFKTPSIIYFEPNWITKWFVGFRGEYNYYPDLHTYMKEEKPGDTKMVQNTLRHLPKVFMQMYFRERSADDDNQPVVLQDSAEED